MPAGEELTDLSQRFGEVLLGLDKPMTIEEDLSQ